MAHCSSAYKLEEHSQQGLVNNGNHMEGSRGGSSRQIKMASECGPVANASSTWMRVESRSRSGFKWIISKWSKIYIKRHEAWFTDYLKICPRSQWTAWEMKHIILTDTLYANVVLFMIWQFEVVMLFVCIDVKKKLECSEDKHWAGVDTMSVWGRRHTCWSHTCVVESAFIFFQTSKQHLSIIPAQCSDAGQLTS